MFGNRQYDFDKVLPFGLCSAPYIFNQFSDAIEWILLNKCSTSFVCHILDDFLPSDFFGKNYMQLMLHAILGGPIGHPSASTFIVTIRV